MEKCADELKATPQCDVLEVLHSQCGDSRVNPQHPFPLSLIGVSTGEEGGFSSSRPRLGWIWLWIQCRTYTGEKVIYWLG